MNNYIILFYILTTLALTSAAMVILSTHTIYAALFLILSFFNTALVILLLGQDFLAVIFVLVYVGAIMILFLFAIMMLDIKYNVLIHTNIHVYYGFTIVLLLFLYVELIYIETLDFIQVHTYFGTILKVWFTIAEHNSSILNFSWLYTMYYLYVVLAGMLLLVAMVGAIILTMPNDHTTPVSSQFTVHKGH